MRNFVTFALVALSTLYIAVAPASAHGYVSQPPSRQARCRNGEVPNCGDVRFEPQSVEAPQGSFRCNGDGARFPELNNEALWQGHTASVSGGSPVPFTWTNTAVHRTTKWEYFSLTQGNALLASFNGNNATPPAILTHAVPMRSTGKQTILARWTIGDTANAFYSCVDLVIT